MSYLAKMALIITALGLVFGMVTLNDKVLDGWMLRPSLSSASIVSTARFPVQRSDLLVVLPSSIQR